MKEWKFTRPRAGWAGGDDVRIRFVEAAAAHHPDAGGGAAVARRKPTLYSARRGLAAPASGRRAAAASISIRCRPSSDSALHRTCTGGSDADPAELAPLRGGVGRVAAAG
ncbi:hypothetical protein AQ610_02310 [Burkholderia humptydooensis]|nr:hypothetical protein AQ610_02310 [Burkholderia humptydooensis]